MPATVGVEADPVPATTPPARVAFCPSVDPLMPAAVDGEVEADEETEAG